MSATRLESGSGTGSWLLTGAVMGLLAGVVFVVFEMVVAWIMQGSPFGPPRMISAIALGEGALPMDPTVGIATAMPVALVLHFVLSAVYGAVFGAIASAVGLLRGSRGMLILAATVFGLLLWLVNFYVVAPVAFPWFLMANPVVQFLAHTFFFGTALGLLLSGSLKPGDR
jgi:hypothetical protein